MDKIIEYKGYFGTKYKRHRDNKQYEVTVVGITKEYNDFTYMMVIGSYGKVYSETYKYLNEYLKEEGFSKRELALRALKFLYSYIELFNTEIRYIDADDRNKIIAFLKGGQGNGQYISYDFKTLRKNNTVNNYLGVYRSFYCYLGLKENIFEEISGSNTIIDIGSAFISKSTSLVVPTYSMNLEEIESNEVPSYIRYAEYLDIKKIIDEKFTLREKIIIKLMYEYGLRIGEVLGLTLEDIQGEDITKKKGKCRLVIRNRFSDKAWQHAKNLEITPIGFNIDELPKKNNGYFHYIKISPETFDLLQEYIDDTTSPFSMSDRASQNYLEKNIADKVSQIDIDRNAYVFISKNYTPITGGGWNTIVKEIFIKVGLKIDKEKRTDNLNHRFRHGFAMFKVLHEGYDELKLSHVMRHSDTKSVKMYFKPTEDDLIEFAIKQDELTKRGLNL
ncbi:integrase/recombinase XerD [Bacillus sp. OK048]|nr:integrase/recombinase XerD [Bacillus sp. OK048]